MLYMVSRVGNGIGTAWATRLALGCAASGQFVALPSCLHLLADYTIWGLHVTKGLLIWVYSAERTYFVGADGVSLLVEINPCFIWGYHTFGYDVICVHCTRDLCPKVPVVGEAAGNARLVVRS